MATVARKAYLYDLEIDADDVVLDVGSGGGNDCLLAGSVGAEVLALDIEEAALDRLRARMAETPARSFRGLVCNLDAGPIPLPDGVASVVLAKEVMEHLEDPVLSRRAGPRRSPRGTLLDLGARPGLRVAPAARRPRLLLAEALPYQRLRA